MTRCRRDHAARYPKSSAKELLFCEMCKYLLNFVEIFTQKYYFTAFLYHQIHLFGVVVEESKDVVADVLTHREAAFHCAGTCMRREDNVREG